MKKKHVDTLNIRNEEGYADPTAYQAIKKVDRDMELEESDRFHNLLDAILYIVELADFDIEGRIVLKDRKTGRVWK